MRLSNRIVFASMNVDKFREFEAILKAWPDIELIPAENVLRNPSKLGFVETHATYLENAAAKARLANQGCHYPSLADDTGLEVEALNGLPGVKTHRYAQLPANERSKSAQDEANVKKLLDELKGKSTRNAKFVTTLTLIVEGLLVHATGALEGTIADAPRGTEGFGYDPIFIPKGSQKTLAEMSTTEKNSISHRALATQNLMVQLQARGIVLAKP
jgi:XTP/dITP diphosphohydrolase